MAMGSKSSSPRPYVPNGRPEFAGSRLPGGTPSNITAALSRARLSLGSIGPVYTKSFLGKSEAFIELVVLTLDIGFAFVELYGDTEENACGCQESCKEPIVGRAVQLAGPIRVFNELAEDNHKETTK